MIFFNTRFNGEIEYISEIYSNPNINTKYYADLPLMVTQYTGKKPREWFPYNVIIVSPNTYEYKNGEFVDKVTLQEYIEMNIPFHDQAGMSEAEMRQHCETVFPTLKRWKNNK